MAKTKSPKVNLPVAPKVKPYNPLDKIELGESIARALLATPAHKLPLDHTFEGAGDYVIYYVGDFPPYTPLTERNAANSCTVPIYVGKAVPSGSRKGGMKLDGTRGKPLFNRIKKHVGSIEAAKNLKIEHFYCRYLLVDDVWIPLGENMLIEQFKPVWNMVVDGFGNNPQGERRDKGIKSLWDTLHPGREPAEKLQPNPKTAEDVVTMVEQFFEKLFKE